MTTTENEPRCYAHGSRGISCTEDLWHLHTVDDEPLCICSRHYDILAEIQKKPNTEQIQRKRVANTLNSEDSPLIPDKDWWERTLLPSYRRPW